MAGFWGVSRAIEPLDSNGLTTNDIISIKERKSSVN